jgi:predicted HTH domain antitoxin
MERIFTSKDEISQIIANEVKKNFEIFLGNKFEKIEEDKISKTKAAKFIGVSIPTLNKLVNDGKFKQHSLGHKKYFLKSELIGALKDVK